LRAELRCSHPHLRIVPLLPQEDPVRLSTRNQVAGAVAVTVPVKSTEVTLGVED
jgi:hypothetical protein